LGGSAGASASSKCRVSASAALVTDREKIELAAEAAADLIADAALLEAVCRFQAGKDLLGGGFPVLEAGLGQGVAHLLVDLVNRPLVYAGVAMTRAFFRTLSRSNSGAD
jgi:hypothetical protein